jgi:hypothetical protein
MHALVAAEVQSNFDFGGINRARPQSATGVHLIEYAGLTSDL